MTFLGIVAGAAALGAAVMGGAVRARRAGAADADAVRAVADRRGWSYAPPGPRWSALVTRTPPAAATRFGRECTVANVVEATIDGVDVTLFHLRARNTASWRRPGRRMILPAARNRTEHTYCAMSLPERVVPMTVCRPADWAVRHIRSRHLAHHYLSGDPDFDERFVLTTGYPGDAALVFTVGLKELVARTEIPFAVTPSGYLLAWREGRITDDDQLVELGRTVVHLAADLMRR